jgi:glutamate 5-kinase
VDPGARLALRENGKSLLPKGVTHVEGNFQSGEVVRILDEEGTEFARGIAESDSESFESWKHQNTEIIHRDNLVIL